MKLSKTIYLALGLIVVLAVIDYSLEDVGVFRRGPTTMDVDIAVALKVFDKTCMQQTVYKEKPENLPQAFINAGMINVKGNIYSDPNWPISAYTLKRPLNDGYECIINFVSFEDIETVIRKTFVTFTNTRL